MIPKSDDIRFELTTLCNYDCIICPREQLRRPKTVMSTPMFSRLLDAVLAGTDQYRLLTFAGLGEPMLDPDFLDKVRVGREAGLEVLLLTNGSRLTEENFRRMDELGVQSVRVSFYGMTNASYAAVHRPPDAAAFDQMRETLERIAAMPRRTKLLMTFNVVPGVNEADLAAWLSHWEPRVDLVEAWRPHNWVYGRALRPVSAVLRSTCGRPFTGPLQIQADGTVNMCCFDFNGDLTLGDLNSTSLAGIFDQEPFLKLARCHRSGDFAGAGFICERCDQRNVEKDGVMVYNSQFDIAERVEMTSTGYAKLAD